MTRPYHKDPKNPHWRRSPGPKTPTPVVIPELGVPQWDRDDATVRPQNMEAPPAPPPKSATLLPGAVIGAEQSRWCLSDNHGWCRGMTRRYMTAPIDREISERCRCECHGRFV